MSVVLDTVLHEVSMLSHRPRLGVETGYTVGVLGEPSRVQHGGYVEWSRTSRLGGGL